MSSAPDSVAPKADDGRILVACDTCVLFNFLNVTRLDLLIDHQDYAFVISEHIRRETLQAAQAEAVSAAVSSGAIKQVSITDPGELVLFDEIAARLGLGEAATIAIAEARGWVAATDDKAAIRIVQRRLGKGRLLTTPGVLLQCIRTGTLSVIEADGIKAELANRYRFHMTFGSFVDLLPQ